MSHLRKTALHIAVVFLLAASLPACSVLQEWYDSILNAQEEEN